MSRFERQVEQSVEPTEYEAAISSGGATAVLAGIAAFMAFDLAGLTSLRRIGGISGGAIVSSMKAAGVPTRALVHLGLDTEFGEYLNWSRGFLGAMKIMPKEGAASDWSASADDDHPSWPSTGIWGSEGLGAYIHRHTTTHDNRENNWPELFWTLATTKEGCQVFFNKDGVFLISLQGEVTKLSDKPVPLQTAVRFSCTIPGVMAALEYQGRFMFDGAMSRDGLCPVGVLIRHFGADPKKLIACRVGEDTLKPVSGRLHRIARRIWRVDPDFHWGPETAGVIEFRPQIEHVHSLKFNLSRDDKWLAILVSLEAALTRLAMEGILHGDKLAEAREIFNSLGYWRDALPAPLGSPQLLSRRVERCLSDHNFF